MDARLEREVLTAREVAAVQLVVGLVPAVELVLFVDARGYSLAKARARYLEAPCIGHVCRAKDGSASSTVPFEVFIRDGVAQVKPGCALLQIVRNKLAAKLAPCNVAL